MSLQSDLHDLIALSHGSTWQRYDAVKKNAALYGLNKAAVDKWQTPGEPAFVSNLVQFPFASRRLVDIIERHLSPRVSAGTPLVSGVFIHQKPKVRFGKAPTTIELGDVLFVRHHFHPGSTTPQGRAFLLQAKSSLHPHIASMTPKEEKQFDLYADWTTEFSFPYGEIGHPPSGKKWDFSKGPSPYADTGVYGLVSNERSCLGRGFPLDCTWTLGPARTPKTPSAPKQITGTQALSAALANFLIGTLGRPWYIGAPSDDHWSHFVEEILARSLEWKYPVQRIGASALPRRVQALSLVEAYNSQWLTSSFVDLLSGRFVMGKDELGNRLRDMESVRSQASEWRKKVRHLQDGEGDAPPAQAKQFAPGGGMSVLYVATFGDGRLEGQD